MNCLWVVSYDVADDKRRRRVHALLSDYGVRVQWSVFECFIDAKTQQWLQANVVREIDIRHDSVRWYGLCACCQRVVTVQGEGRRLNTDPAFFLV